MTSSRTQRSHMFINASNVHKHMTQYHVIHNWLWLGAVESLDQAAELTRLPAGFDQMFTRSSVSLCSAETIRCIRFGLRSHQ